MSHIIVGDDGLVRKVDGVSEFDDADSSIPDHQFVLCWDHVDDIDEEARQTQAINMNHAVDKKLRHAQIRARKARFRSCKRVHQPMRNNSKRWR